jgi:hypothetical protein
MKEFSINQRMKCGQAEQSACKYKKIIGKTGVWYIAIQPNEGDNIYFARNNKKYSDGFAGSTLDFELEDGSIDHVQGPWHSNSRSLLADTGYDTTHKHITRGIIALDAEPIPGKYMSTRHEDVLYYDEEPVVGDFERITILARDFANKLGKSVYAAQISNGGGSAEWIKPKE